MEHSLSHGRDIDIAMDFFEIISTVVLPAILLTLPFARWGNHGRAEDPYTKYVREMEDMFCAMEEDSVEIINMLNSGQRIYNRSDGIPWELPKNRGWFHDMVNGGQYGDTEWKARFRITKPTFMYIADAIRPHLQHASYRRHMTAEEQLATCLTFLAHGGNYMVCAEACGWSRSSVCRTVKRVCTAIKDVLGPQHLRFPNTKEEIGATILGFRRMAGLPQVVGAVDGTHIPIKKPMNTGDSYINRKGFFLCQCSCRLR